MTSPIFHNFAEAPAHVAPFSHAVECDGWIQLTGQMPTDPDDDRRPLPKGVRAQTRRVMENLNIILCALNLKLEISIVCDKAAEQLLNQKLPILKDAYIQDLFSFIPRKLRKNSKLDKDTLKRRLEIIGNKTIGRGKILSINIINYSEAAEDEISKKSEVKDKDTKESKEETSKD